MSNWTVGDFESVNRVFVGPLGWGKTHAFIASVALKLLKKRRVSLYILPCREIWGIALARPGRAIAIKLNAAHAKIPKIERVSSLATREIMIAH